MKNKWFTMKTEKDSVLAIDIFGEVGYDVTFPVFKKTLDSFKDTKTINLSINSIGGSVFEGFAIYNALRSHKAEVHVVINGLAASIASIIAMAGDTIAMYDNSYMMIHLPSTMTWGDEKAHDKNAELLKRLKDDSVRIYQTKFALSYDELVTLLEDETWFDAKQLKEMGVINDTLEGMEIAAKFDLTGFTKAPEAVTEQYAIEAVSNASGEVEEADEEEDVEETEEAVEAQEEQEEATEAEETEEEVEETEDAGEVTGEVTGEVEGEVTDEVADETDEVEEGAEMVMVKSVTINALEAKLNCLEKDLVQARLDNQKLTDKMSELTKQKDTAENDSISAQARLEKLLGPAMKPAAEEIQTWSQAMAKCGGDYQKARQTYGTIWKAYIEQANK